MALVPNIKKGFSTAQNVPDLSCFQSLILFLTAWEGEDETSLPKYVRGETTAKKSGQQEDKSEVGIPVCPLLQHTHSFYT